MRRSRIHVLPRRIAVWAVCYVLALQAFLAAYGTAFAVSRAGGPEAGFAICHGGDTATAAGGDTGKSETVPCALCAVAAAAGGLLPIPATVATAPLAIAGEVSAAAVPAVAASVPARAGLSRAPPAFA